METYESSSTPELVKKRAHYYQLVWTLVLLGVLVLVSMLVLLIMLNLETHRTAQHAEETAVRIEDCTSPSGECYNRSVARTDNTVSRINEITVLAAYCAKEDSNDTVDKIQRCIEKNLDR